MNDPADGALGPLSPRPRGRSRLGCRCPLWPCCSVLIPRANTPNVPHNRRHFCREHRRSDPGLFGSEGARQVFPPFRRRCAALTRAMRSRCSGSYRSVGGVCGVLLATVDRVQKFRRQRGAGGGDHFGGQQSANRTDSHLRPSGTSVSEVFPQNGQRFSRDVARDIGPQ